MSRLLTVEGTSISVGGAYTQYYCSAFSPYTTTQQAFATNGASIATIGGRIATVQAAFSNYQLNLLFIEIGANDFGSGNSVTNASQRAALMQYYTDMRTYAAANGIALKIIGTTLLPHGTAHGGSANYNAERNANVNPMIRAAVGNEIDAVVDWAADPILGPDAAGNDTSIYGDAIHPTSLGRSHMTRVLAPVLNTFLDNTTGRRRLRGI
jgi:lysophospholipase L1-like esterase